MSNKRKINRNNIVDIFALSPMQEGMLFHYLRDGEEKDLYFEQLSLNLSGKLNLMFLKAPGNLSFKIMKC